MGSLNITSALGSFTTIKESNSTVTKENGHAGDNKKKPATITKKGRAILGRSCSNKDRIDTKLVAKEDDIKIAKEGPKTVTEKMAPPTRMRRAAPSRSTGPSEPSRKPLGAKK